jgi:DNA-directed RNA polymerase III subunit RPC2
MNKASLDRGFGRCIVVKKYGAVLRKYANRTQDRIVGPPLQPGQPRPTGRCGGGLGLGTGAGGWRGAGV